MIAPFLALATFLVGGSSSANLEVASSSNTLHSVRADKKAEYEAKRKAAEKSVEKLWDLYLWCDANAMDKEGRSCLRAILKEDDGHRAAHEALGHLEYEGQWFTTQKKLDQFKKEEEERQATEKGLVRYEGEWVPREHVPFLEKGLSLDADGNWVNAEVLAKLEAGWVRQDLAWISPEEKENIGKGLWKCGDSWMSLADANSYHAQLDRMWVIPADEFIVHTTCDRSVAMKAADHMKGAYRDITRALAGEPTGPVHVVLLSGPDQYNAFAAGDDSRPATELTGLSSIHHSYFAESWFGSEGAEFMGAGVGYWDSSSDAGNSWGIHSARSAAALSLIESFDPSPKALATLAKSGPDKWKRDEFWAEKNFPTWYRIGLASYAERYFTDQFVASGGDYHWARKWSLESLRAKGGARPLKQIFDGELSADRYDESTMLLNELGLVIAFVLDGECAPVVAAHNGLRDAIGENDAKKLTKAFAELKKALLANEKALRVFAGH